MAYKITKYGGKHKIKDTKTGKSMDIDIEKYMKGGTPKYELGTDGKSMCPDWDVACKKREADLAKAGGQVTDTLNNMNSASAAVATEGASQNMQAPNWYDQNKTMFQTGQDAYKDPNADDSFEYLRGDANLDGIVNGMDSRQQETRDDVDYSIPNPYGGVDLPSAANYLGQSIQNRDTMGTVVSSLKLATGLGRNLMSGMGQQNRYNQQMGDFYKNLKNKRTPELNMEFGGQLDSYAYGGKKDEEMATGEYMRGVSNENSEDYNAEIEKGEYFQSNEGDISEVVGDTHAQGGEKIQMEKNDRVLSDKSTIGAKAAKMLTDKYGVTLKASNTYSDVLDKVKKKSKLNDLVKQEGEILKKISAQSEIKDATTRDFNLDILSKKKQEIAEQKSPIEEERKMMFDELFDMQEAAKPKVKEEVNSFANGGQLDNLAKEYGISIERAKELVQQYESGGVAKYVDGGPGYSLSKEDSQKRFDYAYATMTANGYTGSKNVGELQSWMNKNYPDLVDQYFEYQPLTAKHMDMLKSGTPAIFKATGISPNKASAEYTDEEKRKVYDALDTGNTNPYKLQDNFIQQGFNDNKQDFRMPLIPAKLGIEPAGMVPYDYKGMQPVPLNIRGREETKLSMPGMTVQKEEEIKNRNNGLAGSYLFPDQSPLPPSALQGTLKPEARFDRVSATEIDATPYLQSIRDNSQAQMQSLEGLSPNVRQAIMQNANAASQDQESKTRMNIDTAYLQSQEKAQYTNAQTQMREQLQNNNYRQGYESRMFSAQAKTDNDVDGYYNQLQDINKQRYMDINNLNLANANNEDVYFDGQSYKRKNTDKQILDNYRIKKGLV
jgi:hypothetical protein